MSHRSNIDRYARGKRNYSSNYHSHHTYEYKGPRDRSSYESKNHQDFRKSSPRISRGRSGSQPVNNKINHSKDTKFHNKRRLSTSPISDEENSAKQLKPMNSSRKSSLPPPVNSQDDRLDRLEKMMEILVNKSSTLDSQKHEDSGSLKGGFPEFIPRNSNFTTSMWINCIEEEAINQNFDERQTISFATSKMTGVIKAWYNSISCFNFSWPELKLLMLKSFPDNRDFAATLEQLVMRKKETSETWINYFFSKLYLLEACKVTGCNAVSCLIAGFNNPQYQYEANGYNFMTPESLYSSYITKLMDYDAAVPEAPPAPSNYDFHSRSEFSSNEDCRRRIEKKKMFYRK